MQFLKSNPVETIHPQSCIITQLKLESNQMSLILNLLFPKKCVGCRRIGGYFCSSCIRNIKQADLVCPKCEKLSVGGQTHPVCRRKFGLDGLWSLGIYNNPLKEAIKQIKYRGVRELSESLVDVLVEYWANFQPFVLDRIKKDRGVGWIVVPIPLHWFRENSRGFNQSSLIGESFAKKLGLKYMEALKRARFTKSQVKLKGKERHLNIKDAFTLNTQYLIRNTNILLIDDVWTTGSTMRECGYVLKKAGAKQVWGITLAR